MAELLPTLQARALRQGLVDYLTTTFALADPEAAQALTEFLSDPERWHLQRPVPPPSPAVPSRRGRLAAFARLGPGPRRPTATRPRRTRG